MDSWNPETFDSELRQMLERNSELIATYFEEYKCLMDENLNSDPYESLKPNKYFYRFKNLKNMFLRQ